MKDIGRIAPRHVDLFDRALLDYAHNILMLGYWRIGDVTQNHLVLKLLRKRRWPNKIGPELAKYTAKRTMHAIRPVKEPLVGNLRRLGELLALDSIDLEVFQFALAISDNQDLREIALEGTRRVSHSASARIIGGVLALDPKSVARALGPKGRLTRCGLIDLVERGDLEDRLSPKEGLLDLLSTDEITREKLLERFLPNVATDAPPWLDHSHLDKEVSIARDLLANAVATRAKGINVLLYGESGTGKTELAKRLAREIAVPLYAARANEDTASECHGPMQRMSSLLLGLRIVETGGAMVLFDELEDLFERSLASLVFGKIGAVTAKDTFNRMFEENAAPVIWTTNHVSSVDPAFLRRFSYAIAVRPGGIRQRARVLKNSLGLPTEEPNRELDRLAEHYDASPAQVAVAARAARLVGDPPSAHLAPLLEGSCRLLTGRWLAPPPTDHETYLVDAINASIDLELLAARLAEWKPSASPGVTMCLYGPPGTGKSEFVRYLARRLGRRVLVKRASDVISPFIGMTERKIADAFEQASADDAVLVFDEVDSFLRDRRDAQRPWEVTEVNEMLQQLESYSGIVACTTNLWAGLDPAVLRRFTFKIELKPPTLAQATRLFWAMFTPLLRGPRAAHDEASVRRALSSRRATPGDLAAVRRRILTLGDAVSVDQILGEISVEVQARGAANEMRGFAPPSASV